MKLEQARELISKPLLVTAVVASLLGIGLGYGVGNWSLLQQQQRKNLQLSQLQQQFDRTQAALAEQTKQADYLTAELAVEKNASQLQMQDLKAEQQKLFETRKELAFYQKIISPDLQANSLIVDSFTVTPGNAVGRYRFNLVLIEQDKQKNFVKGVVELNLVGKKAGKTSQVDLLKLAGYDKSDRRFSFKHFQIFEGEFVLPAAFVADQVNVTVSVLASRGQKAAKVSKSLAWLESSGD